METNEKLDELHNLLYEIAFNNKRVLNGKAELSTYTGIPVKQIDKIIKTIPRSKQGKRLYFDKTKIDEWLLRNEQEVECENEIITAVENYLLTRRKAG